MPVFIFYQDIYSTTDSVSGSLVRPVSIVEFANDNRDYGPQVYVNAPRNFRDVFTTGDSLTHGYSYTALLSDVYTTSVSARSTSLLTRGLSSVFTTGNILNPNYLVTAYFKPHFSAPVSAVFRQSSEEDTVVSATFFQSFNTPVSAIFRAGGNADVVITANLGSVSKSFDVKGTYRQTASTDLQAQITIQNGTVFKPPAYASNVSYPAFIRIQPGSTVPKPRSNINTSILITVKNVQTTKVYTTHVLPDGYWYINDLPAGTYEVSASLGAQKFDPPVTLVQLGQCSPTVYFTEVGVFDIGNQFE